jgi:malate dehydrogenase (oxaloacetate-decarboxylating)
VQIAPKCPIHNVVDDFAVWYTPGVAAPCRAIQENPDLAYEYSSKSNTVAIVTDSTRVQGLQVGFAEKEIRAVAGLPLMEGKALLFKYLGGVDAIPICLGTQDPDEIVQATKWLQPSFGGVNLEDISQDHPRGTDQCPKDCGQAVGGTPDSTDRRRRCQRSPAALVARPGRQVRQRGGVR